MLIVWAHQPIVSRTPHDPFRFSRRAPSVASFRGLYRRLGVWRDRRRHLDPLGVAATSTAELLLPWLGVAPPGRQDLARWERFLRQLDGCDVNDTAHFAIEVDLDGPTPRSRSRRAVQLTVPKPRPPNPPPTGRWRSRLVERTGPVDIVDDLVSDSFERLHHCGAEGKLVSTRCDFADE